MNYSNIVKQVTSWIVTVASIIIIITGCNLASLKIATVINGQQSVASEQHEENGTCDGPENDRFSLCYMVNHPETVDWTVGDHGND